MAKRNGWLSVKTQSTQNMTRSAGRDSRGDYARKYGVRQYQIVSVNKNNYVSRCVECKVVKTQRALAYENRHVPHVISPGLYTK